MNFAVKMATRLRLENRLDGAGNFVPWKARLVLILEENELWDEVVNNTTQLTCMHAHGDLIWCMHH